MFPSRTVAAVVAATVVGLSLTACGGSPSSEKAAGSDARCPNGEIRFGVEPYEDPEILIPLYEKIGASLEKQLDCPVQVQIADTYVAEILAMKNGELDLGQFGPLGYVFARKQAGAVPIVSFADESGKPSSYTGGIWVRKGSAVKSVEDLTGKSLALSEPGSTSGDAVPRKALIDAGVESDVEITYAGGHTEALLALTNGKVDAAEINSQTVKSAVAEGTFDPAAYVRIWESEPIVNDPITVSPKTSPEFQEAVRKALLALPKEDVAALGEYLDFTSPERPLVEVTEKDYQPVVDLAEALDLSEEDL
ncbi:phosphate/phosphite/phosphonate ABC transporter substrate-binding protein [Streptomyces sp. NPDC002640]